jgi:hypothetical protein
VPLACLCGAAAMIWLYRLVTVSSDQPGLADQIAYRAGVFIRVCLVCMTAAIWSFLQLRNSRDRGA